MPLSLVLALVLALWPFPTGVRNHKYYAQNWVLDTKTDPFTRDITCRLTRGGASYRGDSVIFRFPSEVDTSQAVYRVDKGPIRRADADILTPPYIGLGEESDDATNPSGGLVRIPFARLHAASFVTIEAKAYSVPVRFKLGGLEAAIHGATGAGCGVKSWGR